MDVQKSSVEDFKTGHGIVCTSAQAAGPGFPCAKGVTIKADLGNSDNVYVGHSAHVTASNGYKLGAGKQVFIPIDRLDKVFVIGGDSSQGFSYSMG